MTTKPIEIPAGLDAKGRKAAQAIIKLLKKHGADDLGSNRFYTPQQWRDRGEEYGRNSVLVITYDGGDHRRFFNMDACYRTGRASDYDSWEEMQEVLREAGFYFEECTCWYAAVYAA